MLVSTSIFVIVLSFVSSSLRAENVHMTQVFVLPIEPSMFNWTLHGVKSRDQYEYRPSQINSPDLPLWINYVYSPRHQQGFLYGVPPPMPQPTGLELEIVALNKLTYETRRRIVPLEVLEKYAPAQYEVQLKIHNLNVEDLFERHRRHRLLEIFKQNLWTESADDLHVTMLASAVQLGARLPLRPTEGEGVVLRLGSSKPFSQSLSELQEEVRPLWKLQACPRDYKRTSVERIFRDQRFALDWCSFRLLEKVVRLEGAPNSEEDNIVSEHEGIYSGDIWDAPPSKANVPQRSYTFEFVVTILVPMIVLILLVILLSFILCFHHEGISKRNQEGCESVQMLHYTPVQRPTDPLRSSLSLRRLQSNSQTPDRTLAPRSLTTSPTSTLPRSTSPPMLDEDAHYTRPNPPPYAGTYNNNNNSSSYAQSDF